MSSEQPLAEHAQQVNEPPINKFFRAAIKTKASDLHLKVGQPPKLRIQTQLKNTTGDTITEEQMEKLTFEILTKVQKKHFLQHGTLDFAYAITEEDRFRVNLFRQRGLISLAARRVNIEIPSLSWLNLPPVLEKIAESREGLVLATGPTGCGKTTTAVSMTDHINQRRFCHIVTIEDPIEYVHTNKKGVVRQRETGKDTQSFYTGLRAALRQDPDVIAIGEMRDYETIRIALAAAETGVLVLSTLHAISIDKIIERLLSYAPSAAEGQLRFLLAESLQGIVHQELIPTIKGGQRVATEVMITTNAARNILRRKGGFFLRSVIETGKKLGMITMTDSVNELLREKIISEDSAKSVLVNYK